MIFFKICEGILFKDVRGRGGMDKLRRGRGSKQVKNHCSLINNLMILNNDRLVFILLIYFSV